MLDIEREYEILEFKRRMLEAEINMQAMIAENAMRASQHLAPAYTERQFAYLIKQHQIGPNDVPTYRG